MSCIRTHETIVVIWSCIFFNNPWATVNLIYSDLYSRPKDYIFSKCLCLQNFVNLAKCNSVCKFHSKLVIAIVCHLLFKIHSAIDAGNSPTAPNQWLWFFCFKIGPIMHCRIGQYSLLHRIVCLICFNSSWSCILDKHI